MIFTVQCHRSHFFFLFSRLVSFFFFNAEGVQSFASVLSYQRRERNLRITLLKNITAVNYFFFFFHSWHLLSKPRLQATEHVAASRCKTFFFFFIILCVLFLLAFVPKISSGWGIANDDGCLWALFPPQSCLMLSLGCCHAMLKLLSYWVISLRTHLRVGAEGLSPRSGFVLLWKVRDFNNNQTRTNYSYVNQIPELFFLIIKLDHNTWNSKFHRQWSVEWEKVDCWDQPTFMTLLLMVSSFMNKKIYVTYSRDCTLPKILHIRIWKNCCPYERAFQ